MKILIMLFLAGKLLTVTPSASVPEVDGVMAQWSEIDQTYLMAHANLAGQQVYDLHTGDPVTAIYKINGVLVPEYYVVAKLDKFAARNSDEASIDGQDFLMRLLGKDDTSHADDGWAWMTELYPRYLSPGSITLSTCLAGRDGLDIPTGRVFVELVPMVNDYAVREGIR